MNANGYEIGNDCCGANENETATDCGYEND